MTATVAELAGLRSLTDDELAEAYAAGDDETRTAVLAECQRRDRADRARQARQAVESAWMDAAFAQHLAAEAECRGNLLSRKGEAEGITDPFSLWRGSEAWAMARASEELRNFWDANGGRLSLARYRRQLAAAKRADRDERDLADMPAGPEPEPWEPVTGGEVRPVDVAIGATTVPAFAAREESGRVTIHPSRDRAERHLAPAPRPVPAPLPAPPAEPPMPDFATDPRAFSAWLDQVHALRAERRAALLNYAKGLSR